MSSLDAFARLGLLIVDGFIDDPLLRQIRSELVGATGRRAEFYQVATGWKVNEDVRQAKWVEVSAGIRAQLDERLRQLQPRVEEHFQLTLEAFEELQFLRYEEGDYIRLHVDTEANAEGYLGQRKVSVIMFFNDQTIDDDTTSYAGGALVFGIPLKGQDRLVNLPLPVRAGLLVAFPALLPHEVRPITRGVRYSAVTWFR